MNSMHYEIHILLENIRNAIKKDNDCIKRRKYECK